jgi:hypothetical protein
MPWSTTVPTPHGESAHANRPVPATTSGVLKVLKERENDLENLNSGLFYLQRAVHESGCIAVYHLRTIPRTGWDPWTGAPVQTREFPSVDSLAHGASTARNRRSRSGTRHLAHLKPIYCHSRSTEYFMCQRNPPRAEVYASCAISSAQPG